MSNGEHDSTIEAMKQAHDLSLDGKHFEARQLLLETIAEAEKQERETHELFKCNIAPRPLTYSLHNYHTAMSEGPLHHTWTDKPHRLVYDLIAAVKYYAHPQPKQEPVSWESVLGAVARGWCYEENANKTMDSELATAIAKEVHALYPKREWVGLTEEEVIDLWPALIMHKHTYQFWQNLEAKLKEKNT